MRPPGPEPSTHGYSLIEALFSMTLIGIIAAASLPPLASALDRSRTHAAARFIHARMMLARAQSVARGSVVGLRLTGTSDAAVLATFVDGNRNGIRATDITARIDNAVGTGLLLQDAFQGVQVEPVAVGGVLFSFTPLGTSSSGTLYVTGRDGSRFAVRVLGATGRARVLRYISTRDEWTDAE